MRKKIKVEKIKFTQEELKKAREQAEVEFKRIVIREYDMQKPLNLITSQTINDRLDWEDHSSVSFICFEAREDDLLFAAQEGLLFCYKNHQEIARLVIPNWEDFIRDIKLSIIRKEELRGVLVSLLASSGHKGEI